jgi:CPA1 family monovalent cation:H+ antiporter
MLETDLMLVGLVVLGLLALAANRLPIPFPILLIGGGIALTLIPGVPAVHLDPELVFDLFLPPLIYPAAVYISWRDFRANITPILFLATGLVLVTMTSVAFLLHALAGLPLAVAFVFGAIISPPDAVAALSVTKDLQVPRRIVVILEGESLINDASSFISFRFALAAALTGFFSLEQAALQFLVVAAGGVCVGLAIGWLATQVQKRLDDPPVQTMFSLLTPYVSFFAAERLHVSGILSVVITGIYYGWRAPHFLTGRMRLQALPVWDMVQFLLNGALFMLIGLQLPGLLKTLSASQIVEIIRWSALVIAAITVVRFAWLFTSDYLAGFVHKGRGKKERWQDTALIAWTGMRGADSLAGALAIPFALPNGNAFPARDQVLFLTFCVIFGTLLLQGLTIAPLVRSLGIVNDHVTDIEERRARLKANEAALARLASPALQKRARPAVVERLRAEYQDRIRQLQSETALETNRPHLFAPDFEELAREVLRTERETILRLRSEEAINDQALRRILRDIDLAEARLPG